jgi:hypothetical protein
MRSVGVSYTVGVAARDVLEKLVSELALARLLPERIDALADGRSLTRVGTLDILLVSHFVSFRLVVVE